MRDATPSVINRFIWKVNRKYSLTVSACFILAIALRSHNILLHPRFWAEEGKIYFESVQYLSFLEGMGFVANGNYQFLLNATLQLGLLFPVRYIALLTQLSSLLFCMFSAYLVAILMKERGCKLLSANIAVILLAWQISGYEVYLTATNLQWICSLCMLLIIAIEDVPAKSIKAIIRYVATFSFGMTGVPSCILLPVAIMSLIIKRSSYRLIVVLILFVTTAIQISIIKMHQGDIHRSLHMSIDILIPFSMQTLCNMIIPAEALNHIGDLLKDTSIQSSGIKLQIILIGIVGWLGAAYLSYVSLGLFPSMVLVVGSMFSGVVNIFGRIGVLEDSFSGWSGGRYFFLSSAALSVIIASCLSLKNKAVLISASGITFLCLTNDIVTAQTGSWMPLFSTGPSISEQVDKCVPNQSCTVAAWPLSPVWNFTIRGDLLHR